MQFFSSSLQNILELLFLLLFCALTLITMTSVLAGEKREVDGVRGLALEKFLRGRVYFLLTDRRSALFLQKTSII